MIVSVQIIHWVILSKLSPFCEASPTVLERVTEKRTVFFLLSTMDFTLKDDLNLMQLLLKKLECNQELNPAQFNGHLSVILKCK